LNYFKASPHEEIQSTYLKYVLAHKVATDTYFWEYLVLSYSAHFDRKYISGMYSSSNCPQTFGVDPNNNLGRYLSIFLRHMYQSA
jgi:hypothetical protein